MGWWCKRRLGTCSSVHVLASTSFRLGAETVIREPTCVSSPRSDCAIHEKSQALPALDPTGRVVRLRGGIDIRQALGVLPLGPPHEEGRRLFRLWRLSVMAKSHRRNAVVIATSAAVKASPAASAWPVASCSVIGAPLSASGGANNMGLDGGFS